jgi:hypothetical protein
VCVPLYFAACVFVKRAMVGVVPEGDDGADGRRIFNRWLLRSLLVDWAFGKHALTDVSELVGPNLEANSGLYRLLGARVGRHVWWPGTGLRAVEFDQVHIGDNVVFGSRSEARGVIFTWLAYAATHQSAALYVSAPSRCFPATRAAWAASRWLQVPCWPTAGACCPTRRSGAPLCLDLARWPHLASPPRPAAST